MARQKNTRSQIYQMNKKFMGPEPTFKVGQVLTQKDCLNSYTWYNYMTTIEEGREYLTTLLNALGRNDEIKILDKVADCWIPTTICWQARLMTRGYVIPDSSIEFFEKKLAETLKYQITYDNTKLEEVNDEIRPTIKERMSEKVSDIIGELETVIDKEPDTNFYQWLQTNNVPAVYGSRIIHQYAPVLNELIEVTNTDDPQLKEGYRHMNKRQLISKIEMFNRLITDTEKFCEVTKKIRKPRVKKPKTVEKVLKTFKYQEKDDNFKVASIKPEKLINAHGVVLFNTRYKTITLIKANSEGLGIKGTTITNIDESQSGTYRTGRKTQEIVNQVLGGRKVALRHFSDGLTVAPFSSRTNENTIILRIIS